MNQKITFATILVAFSVFFICFTNAAPIELSPRSLTAYAVFSKDVIGKINLYETQNYVGVGRSIEFTSGFTDITSKYEIEFPDNLKLLISSSAITPPETGKISFIIKGRTLKDFIRKKVEVLHNDKVLGKAKIVPDESEQ
ncbi:hypothetical protein Glove_196g13 [Diversispora epigaea]|uniref:Uncharacterized protein n=1 Tax=Diversispora epigaea TaxID=1348612 RepID=A0A397IKJ7_9GLOM|nr:hypothetical protein Glove_196g13 [Diversispora epigaea]